MTEKRKYTPEEIQQEGKTAAERAFQNQVLKLGAINLTEMIGHLSIEEYSVFQRAFTDELKKLNKKGRDDQEIR